MDLFCYALNDDYHKIAESLFCYVLLYQCIFSSDVDL